MPFDSCVVLIDSFLVSFPPFILRERGELGPERFLEESRQIELLLACSKQDVLVDGQVYRFAAIRLPGFSHVES